jgi:hypothetical protein
MGPWPLISDDTDPPETLPNASFLLTLLARARDPTSCRNGRADER